MTKFFKIGDNLRFEGDYNMKLKKIPFGEIQFYDKNRLDLWYRRSKNVHTFCEYVYPSDWYYQIKPNIYSKKKVILTNISGISLFGITKLTIDNPTPKFLNILEKYFYKSKSDQLLALILDKNRKLPIDTIMEISKYLNKMYKVATDI